MNGSPRRAEVPHAEHVYRKKRRIVYATDFPERRYYTELEIFPDQDIRI